MKKYLDAFEKYAKSIGWDRVCYENDDYSDKIFVTLSKGEPSLTSDFVFELEVPDNKDMMPFALWDGLYFGKESYQDTNEPWSDLEEKMLDQIYDTMSNMNRIYDYLQEEN